MNINAPNPDPRKQVQSSIDVNEKNNHLKRLLEHSKLLATDPRKIFGEDFASDDFCSFITDEQTGVRDLLIVKNGMVYLVPFCQADYADRIMWQDRTKRFQDIAKILTEYREMNKKDKYMPNNRPYDYAIGNILADCAPQLKMQSIWPKDAEVYRYIRENSKKSLDEYKSVGELSGIKSDYPLEYGIYTCTNGIIYHLEGEDHVFDSVLDVAGEPLTPMKDVGKYWTNNGITAYVTPKGEIHVAKYSADNEQSLIKAGYKESAIKVPFSGQSQSIGADQ